MSERSSMTGLDGVAAEIRKDCPTAHNDTIATTTTFTSASSPDRGQAEKSGKDKSAHAWVLVVASFTLFLMSWGPAASFGAFQSYYESDLLQRYSPSTISWIGSVQICLLVITGVVSGPIYDRGYFRALVVVGCIMMVVSFMLLSLCHEYYQIFLCQAVLFGLGSGMAYVPALAAVSARFEKNRAVALGFTAAGGSIGGVIFPIMVRRLVPRIGFGWTARIIGFILLGLLLVAVPIVVREPVRKNPPRKLFDLKAFTEIPFLLFSVTVFLNFLAYWIPFFYIPTYAARRLNMSDDASFYTLAVTNAASTFGRILPAFVAQRVGAMPVLATCTLASAVLLFAWIGIDNVPGFYVFCVLWGFFSGIFPSITPVALVSKPLVPDMSIVGTRLGMNWFCGGVGVLIGTPIAGSLVNVESDVFIHTQAFAGAIMTGGLLCMIVPWIAVVRANKTKTAASPS